MTTISRRAFKSRQKTVVAIGNFDGVHIGHQSIMQKTVEIAREQKATPILLTFEPYPQAFFHPERLVPRLTPLREKTYYTTKNNISHIYALPFNQTLANYTAQQFIDDILIRQLQSCAVVVGKDFRFGVQRQGDVDLLQQQKEFLTVIPNDVFFQQRRVSSSWVRENLAAGDLYGAKQLLGRDYAMQGHVVYGDQRGRQLGFPTANIALKNRIPALRGVFVVSVCAKKLPLHYGVANIGARPTVDGARTFLEIYIFDFNADIYGQLLEIQFLHKLRDEKRFDSIDALKAQIARDIEIGREMVKNRQER